MDCEQARLLCSASLDGEAAAGEERGLHQHLAACPACRAFATDVTALHRLVRVAPAEPVPDLSAAILARTELPHDAPAGRALRLGLVAVAVVQVLLSLPTVFADGQHAQHLGAVDLALAVGFIWVAAHPRRALAGFLPIGTTLVVFCVGLSLSDAIRGYGDTAGAVTHSIAVLGMIGAWLLEAQAHRRRTPHGGAGVSVAA
jgi:predicted anti-sigma-YlaC factor YlaD